MTKETDHQWIDTVCQKGNVFLVNGCISVPSDPGNRHYRQVQTWLAAGNVPSSFKEQTSLEELKARKARELSLAFQQALTQGSFFSQTLGKEVNSGIQHLLNVEGLILYLQEKGLEQTEFRCYDNTFVQVTLKDLQSLRFEMIVHRLALYKRKWALEDQVNQAQSQADLDQIDLSHNASNNTNKPFLNTIGT